MKHSKMSQRIAYRKIYWQTALNDESMCTVENFISPARLWSETHNVIDDARPNDWFSDGIWKPQQPAGNWESPAGIEQIITLLVENREASHCDRHLGKPIEHHVYQCKKKCSQVQCTISLRCWVQPCPEEESSSNKCHKCYLLNSSTFYNLFAWIWPSRKMSHLHVAANNNE